MPTPSEEQLSAIANLISGGNFADAASQAQLLIELDPALSEAHSLRGIALSQLGQEHDATDAFKRAIALGPSSAKAYYNFATHLYQLGDMKQGYAMVQRSLELAPGNGTAQDLAALLHAELVEAGFIAEPTTKQTDVSADEGLEATAENRSNPYGESEAWGPITYRAIQSPEPEHTLYFVERMGNWWPAIAWVISGLSAILAVFPFVLLARFGSQFGVNRGTPQGALRDMFVANEYQLAFGLCLFLLLATTVWAVLDVLDRGQRDFVWVFALFLFAIPCCGIASLSWVIIPLYMQFGRKR